MKIGLVTKLDKKKATSKKFENGVMSANCEVFRFSNLWLIWSNLEAGFQTHGL